MKNRLVMTCLFVLTVCLALPPLASAQNEKAVKLSLPVLDLPSKVGTFDVASDTGALIIAFPEENVVRLYMDVSTNGVKADAEYKCPGEPAFVAWTHVDGKARVVVVVKESSQVLVLDDALQLVGKVALSATPSPHVGVARGDFPFVIFSTTGSGEPLRLGAFDLRTLKEIPVTVSGNNVMDAQWLQLSANGKYLYGHREGGSPLGIFFFEIRPGSDGRLIIANKFYEHDSAPGFTPDNGERYLAHSRGVWSADLSREIAPIQGSPIAFLPGTPYYIYSKDFGFESAWRIRVASLNSGATVGAVDVPVKDIREAGGHIRYATLDARHHEIIGLALNKMVVIPLSQIGALDEKDLSLTAPPRVVVQLGETLRLPVSAAVAGATTTLTNGPEGAKVENNVLLWQPNTDQIGRQTVELLVQEGQMQRREVIDVDVVRPGFTLPFAMRAAKLSPDGSKLVVLNQSISWVPDPDRRAPIKIAVMDLDSGKTLASTEIDGAFNSLDVSNKHLLLASNDPSPMARLLELATLKEVQHRSAPARINQVAFMNDSLALLGLQGYDGTGSALDGSVVAFHTADGSELRSFPAGGSGIATDPLGAWVGVTLLDPRTYQPILITGTAAIPVFRSGTTNAGMPQPGLAATIPHGMRFFDPRVQQQVAPPMGQPAHGALLNSEPVVVSVVSQPVSESRRSQKMRGAMGNMGREQRMALDLQVGPMDDPVQKQTLRMLQYSMSNQGVVFTVLTRESASETSAVVAAGDRAMIVDLRPILKPMKLSTPPYVAKVEPKIAVDPDTPTRVRVTVEGGEPPLRFELSTPINGVTVDETTGTVTVDPQSLQPRAVAQLKSQLQPGVTAADTFNKSGAEFARLVGHAPTGIPIAVPIGIITVDSQGRRLAWPRVVLLEIPTALIDHDGSTPAGSRSANAPAAAEQRLAELERENAALRSQVQLLKELLNTNNKSTTQPAAP